jgi:hypothetical protein
MSAAGRDYAAYEEQLLLKQEAAEELYEALRDMVSDHADLSPATLEFARAALRKAEGRT